MIVGLQRFVHVGFVRGSSLLAFLLGVALGACAPALLREVALTLLAKPPEM